MTTKKLPYSIINDSRGGFIGLMNQGEWKEINIVDTKKGVSRGDHYHKHTSETIFIMEGEAVVTLEAVTNPGHKTTITLGAMEGITIQPYTLHSFYYNENSRHIAFLDTVFDTANPDLHLFNGVE